MDDWHVGIDNLLRWDFGTAIFQPDISYLNTSFSRREKTGADIPADRGIFMIYFQTLLLEICFNIVHVYYQLICTIFPISSQNWNTVNLISRYLDIICAKLCFWTKIKWISGNSDWSVVLNNDKVTKLLKSLKIGININIE